MNILARTGLATLAWALAQASALADPVAPETAPAATDSAPAPAPPTQVQEDTARQAIIDSLHPRTGTIALPEAGATLQVTDQYEFYDAADARTILVKLWGNPPEDSNVLGMILPHGDGSWAAVITYEDSGYVADKDAATLKYDELLKQMQESTRQASAERSRQGYGTVELVGWAEQPHYDKPTHKLFWARDMIFGGAAAHELNYDMRVLGRSGVLNLNFLAGSEHLAEVNAAAPGVLAMASFDPGKRYEDYKEGVDRKAEYGIGGLIAGGVALAAAKKFGLLALILAFAKKGWILIVAAIAAIGRMFGGGKKTSASE